MTPSKFTKQKDAAPSRQALQNGLLIALLAAPVPLYLAAQAGLDAVAGVLLGATALLMAATAWLT